MIGLARGRRLAPALRRPLAPALSRALCSDSAVLQQRKPPREPKLTQLGPNATPLELAAEIAERFTQRQWPSRLMLDNLAPKVQTEEEARELFALHQNYVYHMQATFPLTTIEELLQAYYRGSLDTLFEVLASPQRLRVFYQGESDVEVLPALAPELIRQLAADGELERVEQLYTMLPRISVRLDGAATDALVRSLLEAGHAEAAQAVVKVATERRRPLSGEVAAEVEAALPAAEGEAEGAAAGEDGETEEAGAAK